MMIPTLIDQTPIPANPPPRRHHVRLVALLLFVGALVVYARAVGFDFVNYDDPHYVSENPRMPAGLSPGNIAWSFTTFQSSNWHPLTWLAYFTISQLFGVHPAPFHAANILIHATSGVLLFGLLDRMTKRTARAALVAGLFLFHPLHVESVAWVSELKDVLCAMFVLLTIHAYVSYTKNRSPGWYLAVCALFALSLLAKPMAVTLPFLFFLLDYWPLRRPIRIRRSVLEKLPLLAMSAATCAMTAIAQRMAVVRQGPLTLSVRSENAVSAYGRYLAKTFLPIKLAVFYPHPAILGDGQLPWFIGSSIALLAITALAIRQARRRPYLIVGWLWFLGMLVPVIGLMQVGEQAMADRYTYLPLVGVFIAFVWWAADVIPRNLKRMGIAAGILILLLCAVVTEIQLGYWQNSRTLFSHAMAVTRSNFIAMDHLAMESILEGHPADAIPLAVESQKIDPNSVFSYKALARAYDVLGDPEKSLAVYQQAMQIDPADAELHNNAANALAALGRLPEAVGEYQRALEIDPQMVSAYCNLGYVLMAVGQNAGAVEQWKKALQIDPENASAKKGLALAQQNQAPRP